MTGSMAGSFTVHLESAGKCSHEKVQGLQMPKKKRQSVPGNLRRWSDHEAHLHQAKHDHHDHHHQFHIGLVTVGGLRPAIL